MKTSNKNKATTKIRSRRRVRRRAALGDNYQLREILETGISRCKTIEDLRDRMRQMAADDNLWKHIACIQDAENGRDSVYSLARHHMARTYDRP